MHPDVFLRIFIFMVETVVLEVKVLKGGGLLETRDLQRIGEALKSVLPKLFDKVVVISGRLPVWCFCYLVELLHPCRGVATFEPRLGGGVIVSRHHPEVPEIGSVVPCKPEGDIVVEVYEDRVEVKTPTPSFFRSSGIIFFLCGPPKSGKTTVSYKLYKDLIAEGYNIFVERVAPDFEGIWTLESKDYAYLSKLYKEELKKLGIWFTEKFVKDKISHLTELATKFVVIADLGGIPSPENEKIIRDSIAKEKYAILLLSLDKKYESLNKDWKEFLDRLKSEKVIEDYLVATIEEYDKIKDYIIKRIKV